MNKPPHPAAPVAEQASPSISRFSKLTLLLVIAIDTIGISIVYPTITPLFIDIGSGFFSPDLALGHRETLLGLTFACYPFFMLLGALLAGSYSDQWGRKQVLLICLSGITAGYLVAATAVLINSFGLLLFSRALSGICAGCHVLAQATMADISSTTTEKTKNMNAVIIANNIGFVIGPVLGGVFSNTSLLPAFGPHLPFFIAAGFGVISLLLTQRFFQENFVKKLQPANTFTDNLKAIAQLLKEPVAVKLTLLIFLFVAGWNFYYQFLPVYLVQVYQFDATGIGILMGYLAACMAVSAILFVKPILETMTLTSALILGYLVTTASVALTLLITHPLSLWLSIIPLTFAGTMLYTALFTLFSNRAAQAAQGKALGLANATKSAAWVIAPLLSGVLASLNINLPFLTAIACFILAMILAYRIKQS